MGSLVLISDVRVLVSLALTPNHGFQHEARK
jgi:hypothetical protein